MSKAFKINLGSQREIKREGSKEKVSFTENLEIPIGRIGTHFFLPELDLDSAEASAKKITAPVRRVVSRINKFIENIADDYFLLGLHLISLHVLLRESKLSTEQIKTWYAENINMPYSSAMQCRKVAEVYSDDPELIARYTATGAYLLSSCKTADEREKIWQEARGEKISPSIRELRETLKVFRENKEIKKYRHDALEKESDTDKEIFLMSPNEIRISLGLILDCCDNLSSCEKVEDKTKIYETLLKSVRTLLNNLEKKVQD